MKNKLKEKIKSKKITVGIIGLGYVGLPLVVRFCEENINVIGFDIDNEKIKLLANGKTYIKHIPNEKIISSLKSGFEPTSNFGLISKVDAILICVPTPLGVHNEPDLSFILNTINQIKLYLKKDQLIILESTTYPGTTDEQIIPILQESYYNQVGTLLLQGLLGRVW